MTIKKIIIKKYYQTRRSDQTRRKLGRFTVLALDQIDSLCDVVKAFENQRIPLKVDLDILESLIEDIIKNNETADNTEKCTMKKDVLFLSSMTCSEEL